MYKMSNVGCLQNSFIIHSLLLKSKIKIKWRWKRVRCPNPSHRDSYIKRRMMKENSFEVSNIYFGFISILFLILSLFVLYVIFLLPFYTFFTLFLPLGAWCIMILLVAFVIFITCFVTIVTKEYPAETHVWKIVLKDQKEFQTFSAEIRMICYGWYVSRFYQMILEFNVPKYHQLIQIHEFI